MSQSRDQMIAEASAEAMYSRDNAAQNLGIALAEVRPGYARMTMTVKPEMANGHDICHGGMIFSLADTAFAYACNSHNRVTVAQGCSIDFVGPAKTGDLLTAECFEVIRKRTTGVCDVKVTNQDGKVIALFRGKSFELAGQEVTEIKE